ncbi:ATPase [soil metagenome]
MTSQKGKNDLIKKLKEYKKKYYLNLLLRGVIFSLASLLIVFLLFNSIEYAGRFQSPIRAVLFFSFFIIGLIILYKWVIVPILKLASLHKQIDDEEAASQIGKYFPEISDKLLNTIQLQNISAKDNSLLQASIQQKTSQLSVIPFTEAVHYGDNRRFLKYLYVPLLVIAAIFIFIPQFFTESTARIINYSKEYIPEAPFSFILDNLDLNAFKNEDFTIALKMEGQVIPENVYVNTGGRKVKMKKNGSNVYEYTYSKIQQSTPFNFEAAGFNSSNYEVKVFSRPDLKNFNIDLNYPKYLNRKNEKLANTGNIQVPEGTIVKWNFLTSEAESVQIAYDDSEEKVDLQKNGDQNFITEKQFLKSGSYSVNLRNKHSTNKNKIQYFVDVVPDQNPSISLDQFQDTTLFNFMVLGGNISDDYGLTELVLKYKISEAGNRNSNKDKYERINLALDRSQNNQSYYYQWQVDTFKLKEGDKIEYFVEVWDNDAINGRKSAKTPISTFAIPSRKEVNENLKIESQNTEKQLDNTVEKAKELNEKINDAKSKLKGKKKMDWQDEKMLEQLLDKREEINKDIEKLREQNKANSEKRERFTEQSKKIQDKVEQLQKLMDEILDEETKKLYEELKKLLEEKKDLNEIQKALDKLNKKEDDLEKELARALELFKRMKFDFKLEENIKNLEEIAEKQEELAKETGEKEKDKKANEDKDENKDKDVNKEDADKTEEDKKGGENKDAENNDSDKNEKGDKDSGNKNSKNEELTQKQEELNESFKDFEKALEEMEELNQDLQHPEPLQDFSEDKQQIEQDQQKSKEALEKNKKKQAQQNQKNAADKMKQMAGKLKEMQDGMEMTMMQENLDHLRDIMSNLVTLSFDQEKLMKDFRNVNQSDPRFIDLSQKQLKLKDDAKIVEDSLLSLANRVFQIQSFVTREVGDMKDRMDESLTALKERNQPLAISKQQFAMTSINNLALLLDDVLQQMQQQMADAMGKPQKGNNPQKNKGQSLGELQNELNEQIDDLKKSGKSGRELSEELAKMAAEQERIRKALQELEEKTKGKEPGGKGANDITKKMQETESDLVNKQITQETIERQKEILTRLLQAEDAMREKEQDQKREAETAKNHPKEVPKAFDDYIKTKEKEIELLKTIPLKLNPYYKNEVSEYFKRIDN